MTFLIFFIPTIPPWCKYLCRPCISVFSQGGSRGSIAALLLLNTCFNSSVLKNVLSDLKTAHILFLGTCGTI